MTPHEQPLPAWLEEMRRSEQDGKPVRIIFDRPDGSAADMSLDEYIAWRATHPEKAREHPSTIASD